MVEIRLEAYKFINILVKLWDRARVIEVPLQFEESDILISQNDNEKFHYLSIWPLIYPKLLSYFANLSQLSF